MTKHTPIRYKLTILFLLAFARVIAAAEVELPFERGLEKVRIELRVASTGLRALSIAAHPDDEDGGTLSYLRRTLGFETHLCLSTRGEGGQNEAGPELGEMLAYRRTQETEAAAEVLGAKVWYLNMPDFGFSKSVEETLKVWGHERALEQMVRVIRIVRPHVVFTNHDPNGTDHGHHRTTGKILVEAFDAAADATKFAESMKNDGTEPWSITKLYVRRFAPPGATVSFDVSARDAISGLSSSEIGAFALSKHVTQGMSRQLRVGEKDMRYFTLLKSRAGDVKNEKSFLDNLKIETPENVTQAINAALKLLTPEAAADGTLAKAIAAACKLDSDSTRRPHLQQALVEALGIRVATRTDDAITTYDEKVGVTVRVANTGPLPVKLGGWTLSGESAQWQGEGGAGQEFAPAATAEFTGSVTAKAGAFPTYPPQDFLSVRIQSRKPVRAVLSFTFNETDFKVIENLPLDLAKPISTAIAPNPILIYDDPDNGDDAKLTAKFRTVVTNRRKLSQSLKLFTGILPKFDAPVTSTALTFNEEDETLSEEMRFVATVEQLNKSDVDVPTAVWTAETNFGGPVAKLRRVPVRISAPLNVGFVKTYDEATWNALKEMEAAGLGLTVTQLSPDDLRTARLDLYHTIILDLRATQYRPELRHIRERLMDFMKNGGNVVCMYHKDFDWNDPKKDQSVRGAGFFKGKSGGGEIAPYPIELSFDRVTDETAPVRILKPNHPLLTSPCKIWEPDFQGWVQERGAYFPKKWAEQYTPLLSSNDPGEAPLDGGLLVAEVGEGSFIYTSYMLYRQLRAGVPGAYRILVNLISYPRVKRENK